MVTSLNSLKTGPRRSGRSIRPRAGPPDICILAFGTQSPVLKIRLLVGDPEARGNGPFGVRWSSRRVILDTTACIRCWKRVPIQFGVVAPVVNKQPRPTCCPIWVCDGIPFWEIGDLSRGIDDLHLIKYLGGCCCFSMDASLS